MCGLQSQEEGGRMDMTHKAMAGVLQLIEVVKAVLDRHGYGFSYVIYRHGESHPSIKIRLKDGKTVEVERQTDDIVVIGTRIVEDFQKVFAEAQRELLMSEKWNRLSKIAEELDVCVTRNDKICLDIVEVQSLISSVTDDLFEILQRKLREAGKAEG
jgi:predicted DNA-binding antitoxin AbrB/MazE fold protein